MKPLAFVKFCVVSAFSLASIAPRSAEAQSRLRVVVSAEGEVIAGAIVRVDSSVVTSGADGIAEFSPAAGERLVIARKLGYRPDSVSIVLRADADTLITLILTRVSASLTPVVVSSTRTEQRIEDVPIRVEVLAGEDIGEKSSMRPGDLTQMVAEIPGVQVQPLSSGSGGASLRVQGFRSQYTQYLIDGLPLAGASGGGLSLVQMAPLDLAQVEVVKAGASALYGTSALGGVVNFITRRPPDPGSPAVRDFLVGESSYHELDGITFIGVPLSRTWGSTFLLSGHAAPDRDPDGDAWRDITRSRRAAIRPRFFWTGANGSHALLTASVSADNRVNGIVPGRTSPSAGSFSDSLFSRAGDVGAIGHFVLSKTLVVDSRAALQGLSRDRRMNLAIDRARSGSYSAEVSATLNRGAVTWLGGAALKQESNRSLDLTGFDYAFTTTSVFSQLNGQLAGPLSYSVTGRCDHHSRYGSVCVPLVALLAHPAEAWSIRLTGALGSHAPTPFTEETELTGLSRFRPFSGPTANAFGYEKARQVGLDAGYHQGGLDINASLYGADIRNPIGIRDIPTGPYAQEFAVGATPTKIRGADLFAVFTGDPLSVTAFVGLLRSRESRLGNSSTQPGRRDTPLSPKRRAGLDVALDLEEIGARVAVEAYYTGVQYVADDPYRRYSRPFTTIEGLATQNVGRAQLFISVENLTNVVQTSFDPLLLPRQSRSGRQTTDVWAPLSGRVFRLGARVDYSALGKKVNDDHQR